MAELSANLPTEDTSKRRLVDAAPAAPSIFESLANLGSGLVGVADRAINSIDASNQKKKQAAQESALNDAAKAFPVIFGPTVAQPVDYTSDPQAAAAAANTAKTVPQLQNFQKAADQGVMDPGAAQARALAVTRQLYAMHPGYEAFVFKGLKEAGITDLVTQQYKNAETGIEQDLTAQHDRMNELRKLAVTRYGYTNFDQLSAPDQAKALATVGDLELKSQLLDQQTKAASLALQQVQLTDTERKQMQTQTSGTLATSFDQLMTGNFQNLMTISINQLTDPALQADAPRLEKLQSNLLGVAIPAMQVEFNNKLASLGTNITPEDRTNLTNHFNSMVQSFKDILSGPQSVVETNKRIMQAMSDKYGIDFSKTAPTLLRLQKLIGAQSLGILLSPSINPEMQKRLGDELKGVIADPSRTASFSEFVQHLAGEADISGWTPEKLRSMAPMSLNATAALAHNVEASNGTDKDAHRVLVNSIRDTAGIATDVVPQWGFKAILTQSKVLNDARVTRSLFFTTANPGERTDAIQNWVPAVARSYEALKRSNAGDNFYSVQLDPHTLTYKAVWNGKADTRAMPGMGGGGGQTVVLNSHPAPSTAVLEQASTLNVMLNNLSQAASHGFDTSLGGKPVPYVEARRFFATGEVPVSTQQKPKNGKTPEQNVDDAISHMLDFVNKLPTPGAPSAQPKNTAFEDKGAMDKYYQEGPGKSALPNYTANAPKVQAAAERHGVPIGVAMNVIHTESKFNPSADNGTAAGIAQISYKEAARRGWTAPNKMSLDENLDKGMAMLAENYKATGNWHDAVSMYLTGRTLAAAGNAHDKFGTTAPVYAAATVPSNYNWDAVAAAGYTRY